PARPSHRRGHPPAAEAADKGRPPHAARSLPPSASAAAAAAIAPTRRSQPALATLLAHRQRARRHEHAHCTAAPRQPLPCRRAPSLFAPALAAQLFLDAPHLLRTESGA